MPRHLHFPRPLALRPVALAAATALACGAVAQTPPTITHSPQPLYSNLSADPPTLSLALSTEGTVSGYADKTKEYDPAIEFLGYFDTLSCYAYVTTPTTDAAIRNNRPLNAPTTDIGYFRRTGSSNASRGCNDAFSGNFLNFATTSALDIMRLALTGGDRIVDKEDRTILNRAWMSKQSSYASNSWEYALFPGKSISAEHARTALPAAVRGSHNDTVYIHNSEHFLFLGTQRAGWWADPGAGGDLSALISGHRNNPSETAPRRSGLFVRVQVCDSQSTSTPSAWDMKHCQPYPNGKYKPVGALQRNAKDIRVATFGYINPRNPNGATNAAHGGVLYSPMKYLGPLEYDRMGTPSLNRSAEWDARTGVLIPHPDQSTHLAHTNNPWRHEARRSGTINYINMFGSVHHTYKWLDPVGELHYEVVRYLQGLPPTPQAVDPSLRTDAMELFPWWGSYRGDPHAQGRANEDHSCTPQNILLVGDTGNWWDRSLPGNTFTETDVDFARTSEVNPAQGIPDFVNWTRVIRGFEQNLDHPYTDQAGQPRNTRGLDDRPIMTKLHGYPDDHNIVPGTSIRQFYTPVGAAYWARTHDIRPSSMGAAARPGMRVRTFVLNIDQYGTDLSYDRRRNTALYLMAKYGGFDDRFHDGNPYRKNSDGTATDHSLWSRNPYDPHGERDPLTYYQTNQPQQTLDGINSIFRQLKSDINSIAQSAQSSATLNPGQTAYLYRAQFSVGQKTGDVIAIPVTRNGRSLQVGNPVWSAAQTLLQTNPANRKIYIGLPKAGGQWDRTEFTWRKTNSNPTIKTAFNNNGADTNTRAAARLDYLRGVRTMEAHSDPTQRMRQRTGLLGDIIHSGITYMGAPSKSGIRDADYFHSSLHTSAAYASRPPVVFAGANDGMVHAFNAKGDPAQGGGRELFAYIPSWVIPKLPLLSDPEYGTTSAKPAQIFVDAAPAVAEAWVGDDRVGHTNKKSDGSLTTGQWKTLLIGGSGGGGQGVYALDVSNPSDFKKESVLWEFTDRHDAMLGNVSAKPKIVKIRTGTQRNGSVPKYNWFALVPSGVNNYASDGSAQSNGQQAIFLLNLNKTPGAAWVEGRNYHKILIPTTHADNALAAGLVDFSVVVNAQTGVLSKIYAGDLHGNLWRMNFGAKNIEDTVSDINTALQSRGPLFTAKNQAGQRQPITTAPALQRLNYGPTLVAVGTGKYMEASDNQNRQIQTFYTLLDPVNGHSATIDGRSKLKALERENATSSNLVLKNFKWAKNLADVDFAQNKYIGWYFDYSEGERFTSTSAFLGQSLRFNTLTPNAIAGNSANSCGVGLSHAYRVNLQTGRGSITPNPSALLADPVVFRLSDGGAASSGSHANAGANSIGQNTEVVTFAEIGLSSQHTITGTTISTPVEETMIADSFLNWREIFNYRRLYRDANK